MFKPRRQRLIIMLNPTIIRLVRGFHPCHCHLHGAEVTTAVGMEGVTLVVDITEAGMVDGTTKIPL
jgi:hypothetical protein